MYLYWFQGNAPWLHLTILRLHLVFTAINVCLLMLTFAPLIKEHFGDRAYLLYLLSPFPHLSYTIGYVVPPLTRIVTEVGSHGILVDNKTKKEVLRMMKTEKSIKGIMMLTNMKHYVIETRRRRKEKRRSMHRSRRTDTRRQRSNNNNQDPVVVMVGGNEVDEHTFRQILNELYEVKFDLTAVRKKRSEDVLSWIVVGLGY
jgi:hypothetical protein